MNLKLIAAISSDITGCLANHLPALSEGWWDQRVIGQLSSFQIQHISAAGVKSLDKLDLPTLLRLLERNWTDMANRGLVLKGHRSWFRTLQRKRCAWIHQSFDDIEEPFRTDLFDSLSGLMLAINASPATIAAVESMKINAVKGINSTVNQGCAPRNNESSRSRSELARAVIRSYMGWASSAGFIPLPVVDLAAITATQILMLRAIARIYEVPFSHRMISPTLVAMISSSAGYATSGVAISLLKTIPVVGQAVEVLTMPAVSSAACFATGEACIAHLESGGSFLNFDLAHAQSWYHSESQQA
jgi:uncharacterized protein (DUF697 family)